MNMHCNKLSKISADNEFWIILAIFGGVMSYMNKEIGMHAFWLFALIRICVYTIYWIKEKREVGEIMTELVGKIFTIGLIFLGLTILQGVSIQ